MNYINPSKCTEFAYIIFFKCSMHYIKVHRIYKNNLLLYKNTPTNLENYLLISNVLKFSKEISRYV